MNTNPPWVSVGFTLSQIGLETARQFALIIERFGIEPRHFAVLRAVQQVPDQSQHGIGERLGIPASTMVAIVDQLEEGGLLERRVHSTDRRTHALRLTTAGEALHDEALGAAKAHEANLCEGLEARERELLLELLGKVRTSLGVDATTLPDRGSGERPAAL